MQDNYGRTIQYLRLSVTDRCNLRCRYCMPAAGVAPMRHEDILSYEELLRVAAAAVRLGVQKIRVTGGEPLVRRGIEGFIRALAALPGGPEIVLTTNGILLAPMAAAMREAGLSRVNVSLDTLREERFPNIARRGGLAQVLAGLEEAERVGLSPLKLNMVPIQGLNADEIAEFGRLTLHRGWEVRFIEYMPVSADLDLAATGPVTGDAILQALATVAPLSPLPRTGPAGPARMFRYPAGLGRLGVIPAVSEHFCGDCNRLRLTADGRMRPCLFSTEEIDVRRLLRDGCSELALETLLRQAALAKPEKHRIGQEDFAQGQRGMQGIGG